MNRYGMFSEGMCVFVCVREEATFTPLKRAFITGHCHYEGLTSGYKMWSKLTSGSTSRVSQLIFIQEFDGTEGDHILINWVLGKTGIAAHGKPVQCISELLIWTPSLVISVLCTTFLIIFKVSLSTLQVHCSNNQSYSC